MYKLSINWITLLWLSTQKGIPKSSMNNAVFLYVLYSLFKYVFVIESKFLAHQIIVKYVAFQEVDLLVKIIIFSGQKAIILTHALNSTAKRCTL